MERRESKWLGVYLLCNIDLIKYSFTYMVR